MQTLTYGRKLLEDGDKGQTVWNALEDNIALDDAHTHDGVDSAKLTASSTEAVTATITPSWSGIGGGLYEHTVGSLPTGIDLTTNTVTIRYGNDYLPGVVQIVSASSYKIILNDNSIASLTAIYQ